MKHYRYICVLLSLQVILLLLGLQSNAQASKKSVSFFKPEIFGQGIISTKEGYETHPAFSLSGDTLYFLKCAADLSKSSIYVSYKKNGHWLKPELLPFSGKYFDADPFVTKDGNSIYFTSNRPVIPGDTVRPDTDIWKAEKTKSGSWGEPVHLGLDVNSNDSEHYPTIADNGNMYFGSERPGGKGGSDIYCSMLINGLFSSPEMLSDAINTPNNEYEPFIAKDESYLIFMATIPNGLANADFYISYNEQGKWNKPTKLSLPINSSATEWAPKISRDDKFFFFGSTRNSNQLNEKSKGLSDIYQVDIKALNIKKPSLFLKDSLRAKIEKLVQSLDAKIGVSILHIENKDTLIYNGNIQLPMLSVYKFPIAMAVLEQVDKNKLKMEQQIAISKGLIHPDDEEIFSVKNFPDGNATIKDLLSLMLVYGSNTACDVLLKHMKGPEKVQQYIRKLGIKNMVIANTEREIQADPALKYKNWSTTNGIMKLLAIAHKKNVLSKNSYSFLWDKMTASVTAPNRIKGLLAKEAKVAHRTGTANNTYNDAGIITLPNGNHLAIAVFISDAKEYPETCNSVIAQIAKLAWDYYSCL